MTDKIKSFKCAKCGREFTIGDKDYLTFQGNVYLGEQFGIIGNNFPRIDGTEEGANSFTLENVTKTRLCLSCFIEDINEIKLKVLDSLENQAKPLNEKIALLRGDKTVEIPAFLKNVK